MASVMQITEAIFERCDSVRSKMKTDQLQPKKQKKPVGFILLSVLPACILLLVFVFYPTLKAAVLSFQKVGLLTASGPWVGLQNYEYLIKDQKFQQAVVNTLKTMVIVPFGTIFCAFVLAVILHRAKIREKNLYITSYFFPYFMSSIVVAIVWSFVLLPTSNGVLNTILTSIGLEQLTRPWLGDKSTALGCICAVLIVCSTGYYVVLYLSSLDSISEELYESAKLDGASTLQQIWNITLPLMKNVIGITFVLLMSGTIAATFGYCKIMTGGGPNGASTTLMYYIYSIGVKNGNVGYSSAISVFTMVMAITLSFISRAMTSKSEK